MVVKPNTIILRQHYPLAFADVSQPFLIFRVLREVIVVNLYPCPGIAKRGSNSLSSE
jgi:hypothetical protein